jgi:5-methylcytosine-specific restriction endonuclease McrA
MTLPRFSKKRQAEITSGLRTTNGALKGKPVKGFGKRKPTGEAKVFREIWNDREHFCAVCDRHIDEPTASNFSHLFSKAEIPKLRLDKRNIEIWCQPCHDEWHANAAVRLIDMPKWRPVFARMNSI